MTAIGNWAVSEPADDPGTLAGISQGDAILGFAAFLWFVGAALMTAALVTRYRSRQKG
jgi:hypothetical protein